MTGPYAPSAAIPVDYLELALILPVHVQAQKRGADDYVEPRLDPEGCDFLNAWVQHLQHHSAGKWRDVGSDYPPLTGRDAAPAYSEFCYFHPFVRNFLYLTRGDKRDGEPAPTNRNLRILKRTDCQELEVEYSLRKDDGAAGEDTYVTTFKIQSCWLYLFDTQIAMLGLRIVHRHTAQNAQSVPLNLKLTLKLQDAIRHIYAPYWSVYAVNENNPPLVHHESKHAPARLTLRRTDDRGASAEVTSYFGNFAAQVPLHSALGAELEALRNSQSAEKTVRDNAAAVHEHLRHVVTHREPYTAEVWRELLLPLAPMEYVKPGETQDSDRCSLRFEHVRDERAVTMSYVSVGHDRSNGKCRDDSRTWVRKISPGDWLRLAGVDDPGDSFAYPYSPEFFADKTSPLDGFAYDRFWHSTGIAEAVNPGEPARQTYDWMTTRWLCSGYSFACVGNSGDQAFFRDDHAGALCHFRHHYFALGMIALFHHASLLMFKHRLAEASDNMLARKSSDARDSNPQPFHGSTKDQSAAADLYSERLRRIDFRVEAERLAREIMRFRTLYWFSEVSNQLQGTELFDMYRKHLRLQQLFDHVTSDAESAVGLLRHWDAEEQSRASQTLGVMAAVFTISAPLLTMVTENNQGNPWALLGLMMMVTGIVLIFLRIPAAWLTKGRTAPGRCFSTAMRWLAQLAPGRKLGVLAASILIGIVLFVLFGKVSDAKAPDPPPSQISPRSANWWK